MSDLGFRKLGDEHVAEMFSAQGVSEDGVLTWGEFLELLELQCLPSEGPAPGVRDSIAEERATYARIVNHILAGDEDCQDRIPMNTLDDSLFNVFDDGIVLCKLIMAIDPTVIDSKQINRKKTMNIYEAKINLDVALDGARKLGLIKSWIDSQAFLKKNQTLILGTLHDTIKKWL